MSHLLFQDKKKFRTSNHIIKEPILRTVAMTLDMLLGDEYKFVEHYAGL